MVHREPEIDAAQLLSDLDALARIGATPEGGVSRIAFSPADLEARRWVEEAMRVAGMAVRRDPAGNSIGTYPGREPGLAPIALGSHTDTVPNGGRYDGALGVLAALACVRALHAAGQRLRHPVEVINFVAEEATMGGGTFGSRAMAGLFDPAALDHEAVDGRPVAEHLRRAAIDTAQVRTAARPAGSLAAYVELHIEQGGVLASAGIVIGAVEGIVGIRRYAVTFHGEANHAGTTPMDDRSDALVMAAPFILAVREIAVAHGIVGTVGTLRVSPGASNVIPGRVELTAEIRGLDEATLDAAEAALRARAEAAGAAFARMSAKEPVRSDPLIVASVEQTCQQLGLSCRRMPSGAGHDAMCMAALTRQGMIFVPSQRGISHAPDEYTAPEDCVNGARVLLGTLLALDAALDSTGDG
ncbi:MAG: Zn-dependent hydrolase [Sphaerobacter sp.]|nr:Zn-dependent hydrolase [Sphaerobacter sp.]